jgi:molybdate transport system permease protein
VIGFYLLLLFSPLGPVGGFLQTTFGIKLAFSFAGIVVAGCVSGLPFMVSGLKTGLLGVPPSLREASATLGKGPWETLFRVVLPNMKTGLASGILLTFAHTLGEFGVVLMIGGSIPGVTKVVSIAMYERVESLDFGAAHGYALVMIAIAYPGMLLLNTLQRRDQRRQL